MLRHWILGYLLRKMMKMSETITRYNVHTDQYGVSLHVETDNGKWVKYEDVEQIVSELEFCQESIDAFDKNDVMINQDREL